MEMYLLLSGVFSNVDTFCDGLLVMVLDRATAVVLCFGRRCYLSIVEVLSRAASVNVRE